MMLGMVGFLQAQNSESASTIQWMTFDEAVEKSKTDKKKIFIDVYTDWCGWCKVMDQKTFSDPDIARYMNENFHNVKFDAEQKEPVTFRNHTFKYVASGSRGYHELAASMLNNKLSFPTVVFLDEDFNIISPVPGYHKVDFFEKIIKYFGGEHYKEISWKEWEKNFVPGS
jgi:thioredoxin-related protein